MRLMRLTGLAPVLLGFPALMIASFPALLIASSLAGSEAEGRDWQTKALPTLVVNTWAFTEATAAAWQTLAAGGSALDAVEQGCSRCEALQCDRTVGFGGSPDEAGETTLDALIMDGDTMRAGAVSDLRRVKAAVSTARLVMQHTTHTLLAGDHATRFAAEMGLPVGSLSTDESREVYRKWRDNQCQPNFRRNVSPDPTRSCGPYQPLTEQQQQQQPSAQQAARSDGSAGSKHASHEPAVGPQQHQQQLTWPSERAHDTIAMVVLAGGSVAAGSSSNGAIHKVPGRVGDASVPGGGAYADSEVGGCGATGDGDVHLPFLPCYHVVENMRRGMAPTAAAEDAVRRIARRVPGYVGAVVAVSKDGQHGAAAHGWQFVYSVASSGDGGGKVQVVQVEPVDVACIETE